MGLLLLGIFVFGIWMFIDCVTNPVRDKVFWAILILGTGPVGAVIYATKRGKLLGEPARVITTEDGTITVPSTAPRSTSSQVIRGIGMTIGIIFAVGGTLIVGFIILIIILLSTGGGSEGSGK